MSDLAINIIVGTLSGFLGAFILYLIQEYRVKKNKLIISDFEDERIIDRDVIEKLTPGFSIEKAKTVLGAPLIHRKMDTTIFEVDVETNSYIYNFKNSLLKITSQDNIKIDTTTILLKYKSKDIIKFIPSIFDDDVKPFGKCKAEKFILDLVRNHTSLRTMKDASCGIEVFIPNPLYKNFTYFCEYSKHLENYYNSNDINDLLGAVIIGVCLSDEEKMSFYIYENELR